MLEQPQLSKLEIAKLQPQALLSYLLMTDFDEVYLDTCLFQNHFGGEAFALGVLLEPQSAYANDLLDLLARIGKKNPLKLTEYLTTKGSDGRTIGHYIAELQSSKCMDKYLTLLELLLPSMRKQVLAGLEVTNSLGGTIGHYIAARHNSEVNQHFIRLVTDLAQSKPQRILSLLSKQDASAHSICHWIMKRKKGGASQELMALLLSLVDQHPQKIMNLFFSRENSGSTVPLCVEELNTIKQVMQLLSKLSTKYPEQVIDGLLICNSGNENFGHRVGRHCESETKELFLVLIDSLICTNSKKVVDVFLTQDNLGTSVGHLMAYDRKCKNHFLCSLGILALVVPEKVLTILKNATPEIKLNIGYIIAQQTDNNVAIAQFMRVLDVLAIPNPIGVFELLVSPYKRIYSNYGNRHLYGEEGLGVVLINRIFYNENDKGIVPAVLTLLLQIFDTHPQEVLSDLQRKQSMINSIYRLLVFNKIPESLPLFMNLLARGAATNPEIIKNYLLKDTGQWKDMGELVSVSSNPSAIYAYTKLVDLMQHTELKQQAINWKNSRTLAEQLVGFITSLPLTHEKLTIGQNALTDNTTLNCLLKKASTTESRCFLSPLRRHYVHLDRLKTYLNTPQVTDDDSTMLNPR